jgi:hypothetical protein
MRRKVTINGKRIYRSHAVWNETHPKAPILPGEVIHHIDGDHENDSPENLKKMSDFDHRRMESKNGGALALENWRKQNPEKASMLGKRNVALLQEKRKNDPEWAEELREKQRLGTIASNKARAFRTPEYIREYKRMAMKRYRARKKEAENA